MVALPVSIVGIIMVEEHIVINVQVNVNPVLIGHLVHLVQIPHFIYKNKNKNNIIIHEIEKQ